MWNGCIDNSVLQFPLNDRTYVHTHFHVKGLECLGQIHEWKTNRRFWSYQNAQVFDWQLHHQEHTARLCIH